MFNANPGESCTATAAPSCSLWKTWCKNLLLFCSASVYIELCLHLCVYRSLDRYAVYLFLFGLLGGVAVTLAVVLPFAWGENIFTWLVDKYAATLSGYPHATLSTGNLMFLLGGNWVQSIARWTTSIYSHYVPAKPAAPKSPKLPRTGY